MKRSLVAGVTGLALGLGGAAYAQEEGPGEKVDPIKELKEAAEKMRSAEDLLAKASRDPAAAAQKDVAEILKKLLDEAEISQGTAVSRVLKAAEKAQLRTKEHLQKVLDEASL